MHGERGQPGRRSMAAASIEKDWAEVLNEHMKTRRAEEVPTGWMSALQVAKMWNFSKSHANRVLTELVKLKKAERRTFAVAKVSKTVGARGPRGSYCRKVPYYKLVKS